MVSCASWLFATSRHQCAHVTHASRIASVMQGPYIHLRACLCECVRVTKDIRANDSGCKHKLLLKLAYR